jgi:hypothetical protein
MWKKVIDLSLYLVACAIVGTGLLLAYRLPHGGESTERAVFLGYGRHEWGDIHLWLAYGAILLGIVHLVLNRQWLLKVAAAKRMWRLIAGVLCGVLIVAAFLVLPLDRSERSGRGIQRHETAQD